MNKIFLLIVFLIIIPFSCEKAQGNVYLIIGSDTAIWEGMNVDKYECYYNYNVIPDNTRNYFKVMQPSYRSSFSDSYGNKLKLTWWLMCGNIFRYATNKNIPVANLIVPYEAKKYYGDLFSEYGDELTLHYHTFVWSDYDKDGIYYWNQAKEFKESKDDFYFTLAQLLLEENIFPVSFRSGWNHMCNEWQTELDKLIPYSMHNESPSFRLEDSEPIDNIYDWRLASQEFIPYRPSPDNYQLNGKGKGWNLHSKYVGSVSQKLMNDIFEKAKTQDQVVCLWGHVWDDLFPEYVKRIDTLANNSASRSNVKFKYCSAVEGMNLWRKSQDSIAPQIFFNELVENGEVKFQVATDETIFQPHPFFAVKFLDESYQVIELVNMGTNSWISKNSFKKTIIARVGVAVTDTFGNLSTKIINFLPNDIYVDNEGDGYHELYGRWAYNEQASWGLSSRQTILDKKDSVKVRWYFKVPSDTLYNIFAQIPAVKNPCEKIKFSIYTDNKLQYTKLFNTSIEPNEWIYLFTSNLSPAENSFIEMTSSGNGVSSSIATADVIKISPLVPDKFLYTSQNILNFGEIIKGDTATTTITFSNFGTNDLVINSVSFLSKYAFIKTQSPICIGKFSSVDVPIYFTSDEFGNKIDTMFVRSDATFNQTYKIAVIAEVTNYFVNVDNEETNKYTESGNWAKSVVQAFGPSSRYALLNQSPFAFAEFQTTLKESGNYMVEFIVPKTVNSSNHAVYLVFKNDIPIDTLIVDQNYESGKWNQMQTYFFNKYDLAKVKVLDDGQSTTGDVLRADAIKFSLIDPLTTITQDSELSKNFILEQNYPNPFNPITTIKYSLPAVENRLSRNVKLIIYDVLGNEVAILVNETQTSGLYEVKFNGSSYASGVYFYKLQCDNLVSTKKLLLLK